VVIKSKLIVSLLLVLASIHVFSRDIPISPKPIPPLNLSNKLIINNLDSLIFDLANATVTATYIDLPVYIKSDDVAVGYDFAMQFNLTKLTYSTSINVFDPLANTVAFFNPVSAFLRLTSTRLQIAPFPNTGNVVLAKIRFTLSSPCIRIRAIDFVNITGYINGDVCATRVTDFDYSRIKPKSNFINGPTCTNANILFTNTSTVSVGSVTATAWNFSSAQTSTLQNPSISYTSTGTFAATLIATTSLGCKDTIVKVLTVYPPPVSNFTYAYNCLKDTVFFTNSSTVPIGSIVLSSWNFGDQSGTSNATNPAYHYSTSGLFTTTLISTSNFSCSSTKTVVVDLTNKITANFTTTAVNYCIGSVISFSDLSTYVLSNIISWNWNFGDGTTSTLQNPTRTFTTPATYSVTLSSSATDGCIGNITKNIIIYGPPTVQFSAATLTNCSTYSINFTDQSTTPTGSTWNWNFGDNFTSSVRNPSHAYGSAGVYPVKLIVITPQGCSDSLTKSSYLTIYSTPVVSFSTNNGCVFTNIFFLNNTTIASGTITSWFWNFGDTQTSSLRNPTNTYTLAGSYTVSLSSTSDLGCVGVSSQTIVLTSRPFVNFDFNSDIDCSGETLSFSNLSIAAPSPSYLWRFGDNSTSAMQNPIHTYTVGGLYPIKLTITNPGGCSSFLIKSYTVALPPPATALFTETVTADAAVSFFNTSLNSKSVFWDFGDNNEQSTKENPSHVFSQVGNYTVCLTAYNPLNCPTSTCKEIYVGVTKVIAVPSGFTPNDDNVNDVLRVRGGPFLEMLFQVYNQWDNLLFSSTSQDLGWDGTFKGELQPVGVYEYILNARTMDNKKVKLYGPVNLMR
jgi:gliding motility-associated-like protein